MELLPRLLGFSAVALIFIASQLFWIRRLREACARFISNHRWRGVVDAAGVITYLFLLAYNVPWVDRSHEPTHLTLKAALLQAPFRWWFLGSVLSFFMVVILLSADRVGKAIRWVYRTARGPRPGGRGDQPSYSRRHFLEQSALAVSAAPFVASAYGLLYGRVNLETTQRRIALRRLPKAFEGFRVAQLSDIHIGPFMSAAEIRKYADIANRLKADLIVLTGDFLTWDAKTENAAVQALASLKAPFGVFGCLGNHELWTDTEDSITRLFAAAGIRILRQQGAAIQSNGETLNLLGVDFQSRRGMGSHKEGLVRTYLRGIEPLIMPDRVNILLSHNPNTFDRAAELGIDLSLAGHTHGGQVTLEFIHPGLSPSRLITPYVSGWFEKAGAQLYVNRGIGTIAVPIRIGAPPEITVFELVRNA